ncbi:MAG: hypothetical protein R2794_01280 [Chitinophagales bacterium]
MREKVPSPALMLASINMRNPAPMARPILLMNPAEFRQHDKCDTAAIYRARKWRFLLAQPIPSLVASTSDDRLHDHTCDMPPSQNQLKLCDIRAEVL